MPIFFQQSSSVQMKLLLFVLVPSIPFIIKAQSFIIYADSAVSYQFSGSEDSLIYSRCF